MSEDGRTETVYQWLEKHRDTARIDVDALYVDLEKKKAELKVLEAGRGRLVHGSDEDKLAAKAIKLAEFNIQDVSSKIASLNRRIDFISEKLSYMHKDF